MSTEHTGRDNSYLYYLAGGLGLYCALLAAVTGDIGFNGDDWWVLAIPYQHTFWEAVTLYTNKFLRPLEGLYWISLFNVFGFTKPAFHLFSLLLLAGAACLMGVALHRAFPDRRAGVSMAVLFAFFLPPVSCLTYVMFTDNSRLAMLFFWASMIAFQRWAHRSTSWAALPLPVGLYMASFLTYECAGFLIFIAPLLLWPIHRRNPGGLSDRAFLVRLAVAVVVAFGAVIVTRLLILHGGAVGNDSLIPPLELLWAYPALLPFYLVAPFQSVSRDTWAVSAGVLVALGTAGLFFMLSRSRRPAESVSKPPFNLEERRCWLALGAGILLLGMLPYQLASYGALSPRMMDTLMVKYGVIPNGDLSWFNFTWVSRIYSSASFGVAILLAAALDGLRRPSFRLVGKAAALALIGFMVVFHAGLSQDWKEAGEIRNDLVRSLVSQVPAVKPNTNLVFLDLALSHKRAEVIRHEKDGFRELIRMLYADQSLQTWRLYSKAFDPNTHAFQQATALPAGFVCARGQRQSGLSPHDSLLLFKRAGRELVLMDKITSCDGTVPTGIAWRGVDHLASNEARIESGPIAVLPRTKLTRNVWTFGLFSSLHLTRLKTTLPYLTRSKYGAVHNAGLRRFIRLHLGIQAPR